VSESSERRTYTHGKATTQQPGASIADYRAALEQLSHWHDVAERIADLVDLDALAATHGLTTRRRVMMGSTQLLTLALMYGPGAVGLRGLVTFAQTLGLSRVTEASLLRTLLHAAPWLDHVAEQVMIEQLLSRESEPVGRAKRDGLVRLRPYHAWQHIARTAQQFIEDLLPWPTQCFNEAQSLWLMCARWNYVAATLRSAAEGLNDTAESTASMQRIRRVGHLIAALLPET
jgi:hypothetical protein